MDNAQTLEALKAKGLVGWKATKNNSASLFNVHVTSEQQKSREEEGMEIKDLFSQTGKDSIGRMSRHVLFPPRDQGSVTGALRGV